MLMKSFFILGTDTDIGKTYISSLLYKGLRKYGCSYYKPVQSGALNNKSPDVEFLCNFNNIPYDNTLCGYKFEYEVSPHLASEKENRTIDKSIILKKIDENKNKSKNKFNIVEGAGGIFVPLIRGKYYNFDLIKDASLPVILVCSTKVGSINHTMLTLEFLKKEKIDVHGLVFNNYTDKEYEKDNIKVILEESSIKNYLIVKSKEEDILSDKLKKFFRIEE
ncbi:MAG: dethiobiotin synthase [Fusobacteriaceae bacterium]